MEALESLVGELNNLLEVEILVQEEFTSLIKQIKAHKKITIKILDFEYFNEERLEQANKEKIKAVMIQNFDSAAAWRDKEKKIQKYIDIRNELEVTKSRFFYKEDYLLYLYMGTARNDLVIRFWMKEEAGMA
jgi:hypothetical protein